MKTIITIADVHFGALDPKYMYDALTEQFTKKLYKFRHISHMWRFIRFKIYEQ